MSDYISPIFQTGQEVDEALTAGLQSSAALVGLINGGAKNRLPFCDLDMLQRQNTGGTWTGNVYEFRGVTYTINSDWTITATGTATGGNANLVLSPVGGFSIEAGNWIMTGCPSGGSSSTYNISIASTGSDTGSGYEFTAAVSSKLVRIYILEGTQVTNLTFAPMICDKSAYAISQAFVPYRPTYQELYERVLALENPPVSLSMASPQSITPLGEEAESIETSDTNSEE